jgi:hypothetical protein
MNWRIAAAALALSLATLAPGASAARVKNPCSGAGSQHLLCPNLRIAPPSELYLQRSGGGRELLHATSDVESRGRGPMELRGTRSGPRVMKVSQRIYRSGGGHRELPTDAHLFFTDVGSYFGGSYWKVHRLAVFELWSLGRHDRLKRRVRVGPKTNYCLRDLQRTAPGPRSPRDPHYPGCDQNRGQRAVTLGTSIGWSDIYPSDYTRQWINVSGLRGCYAFVMRVDPQGFFYESDSGDNSSRRLVHLPFRADTGC